MTILSKVRVTRTRTAEITEVVHFDITQEDTDFRSPETLAMNLVRAMEAAGQPLKWLKRSEKESPYATTKFDGEVTGRIPPLMAEEAPAAVYKAPEPYDVIPVPETGPVVAVPFDEVAF